MSKLFDQSHPDGELAITEPHEEIPPQLDRESFFNRELSLEQVYYLLDKLPPRIAETCELLRVAKTEKRKADIKTLKMMLRTFKSLYRRLKDYDAESRFFHDIEVWTKRMRGWFGVSTKPGKTR